MTMPSVNERSLWGHGAALAATASIAALAFYGLQTWVASAPPLIMVPVFPVEEIATAPTGLANPASAYCVQQGGILEIARDAHDGQFGICTFNQSNKCEEWAMLRGDCPIGGVAVLATWDAAEMYCALRGGEVRRVNGGLEPSICTFKASSCTTGEFYEGGECEGGAK
jgi:putative hemolysin